MTLEEFETHTRDSIEQALNQLHTATLLAAQLEIQIAETGRMLQMLSQQVETFVEQQRNQ